MKYFIEIAMGLLLILCGCQHTKTTSEENVTPPYPAQCVLTDTLTFGKDTTIRTDTFTVSSQVLQEQLSALFLWQPQAIVSDSAISIIGMENCFIAMPIYDNIFRRINGHSFHTGSPVTRSELRYLRLLHRNFKGENQLGEMIVHQSIAKSVIRIFRELYAADYPIELMVLVDDFGADDNRSMAANNSSCFNVRSVPGIPTATSRHSYGKAIDVNPLYNPYIRGNKVYPPEGKPYVNRDQDNPYFISATSLITKLFREEGFVWGGIWARSKDYQHFQKR